MIHKPIISTITPCFKMEKYLKLFLEELPKQTIFDQIEVVLDHNEPTEQELGLVKEFQNKHPNRLKHLITNPVIPIGTSMNKCIKEAAADYLTIWNVDDLRTPNSLELHVKYLDQDYDVAHGGFLIVNTFGSKTGKIVDHSHTVYKPKELVRGMCMGPFFAFKKALLNNSLYFDEQLITGADFDFAIRLAKTGRVGYIPEFVGYYLDEGRGASTRGDGNQPIERTLIELRYNILDKIEQKYVSLVYDRKYSIKEIVNFGQKISIEKFISKDEKIS